VVEERSDDTTGQSPNVFPDPEGIAEVSELLVAVICALAPLQGAFEPLALPVVSSLRSSTTG